MGGPPWAGMAASRRGPGRRSRSWIRAPRSRRPRRHRGVPRRPAARCPRPLGTAAARGTAAQRGDVGGVEERAGLAFAGVAERPDVLAVAGRDRALERVRHPVAGGDRFDEPDRLLDSGRRVVLEAEGEGEIEQHLGVGLAFDLRIQRRVDREYQVAFDRRELVDVAVVHEQPVVMAERVTVGLLHGAADRRPDMREEQRGTDVAGELEEVVVVPGGFGAVEDARRVGGAVPTDAEPVAVGRLGPELRRQALVRRASWAPRRAPL